MYSETRQYLALPGTRDAGEKAQTQSLPHGMEKPQRIVDWRPVPGQPASDLCPCVCSRSGQSPAGRNHGRGWGWGPLSGRVAASPALGAVHEALRAAWPGVGHRLPRPQRRSPGGHGHGAPRPPPPHPGWPASCPHTPSPCTPPGPTAGAHEASCLPLTTHTHHSPRAAARGWRGRGAAHRPTHPAPEELPSSHLLLHPAHSGPGPCSAPAARQAASDRAQPSARAPPHRAPPPTGEVSGCVQGGRNMGRGSRGLVWWGAGGRVVAFDTGVRKALWWREQHVQSSEVGSAVLGCSEQTMRCE